MKYIYEVVDCVGMYERDAVLEDQAREGWELAAATEAKVETVYGVKHLYTLYFKREKR